LPNAIGLLLIAGWLGLTQAAYAQAETLAPGREARLYVRGAAGVLEGTLTTVNAERLEIALIDGSSFTVSVAQMDRAEVLASRRNRLRGAIVGAGVGLGVGVGLVVRSGDSDGDSVPGGPDDDSFGDELPAWKLIVSSAAGTVVGAVVGYFLRTSRWVPAFVPGGPGPGNVTFAWTLGPQ
jgi:hypothetical protein